MENNKQIQEYIKEYLIRPDGKINSAILRQEWFKNSEQYKQILDLTSWVNKYDSDMSISKRIMLINDQIFSFNRCECCNSEMSFKRNRFCSKSCSYKSTLEIRTTNELQRYKNLKLEQNLHTLAETKDYINSKITNIKTGNSKREAIYSGFYFSINYYFNELYNIKTDNFQEKMYIIHNDIQEIPKCKCLNDLPFVSMSGGYREFCSVSCQVRYNTNKRLSTYEQNTGYSHPHKNPEVKILMEEKCLEKFGATHQWKSEEIRAKAEETCLEKYGCSNALQNEEVKLKVKETQIERYGGYWNASEEIRAKAEETCLEKYGVRNYSQLGITNGYKWYEYELPSGKIIKYQGYEGRYIPILIRKFGEENIILEKSKVPKFRYIYNDKEYYYFPDFYIPKENLIIEVKSQYTYECNKEVNELKFKSVIDSGFRLKVKIFK